MRDYRNSAKSDAADMVEHFMDEIIEQLRSSGTASDDVNNDYPDGDSYHHEYHVDRSYSLTEASALLDQLSEYEETDDGLWQGLAPREAISVQAAYTYGIAVWSMWRDLIKEINEAAEDSPLKDMIGEDDPADDDTVAAFIKTLITGE